MIRLTTLVVLVAAAAVSGQGQRAAAAPPPARIASPAIAGVVAAGSTIELVNGDLRRTEGPVGRRSKTASAPPTGSPAITL